MVTRKEVVLLISILILLSGCASKAINKMEDNHEHEQQQHVSTDIQEKTNGLNSLPEFLKDHSEKVVNIYAAVAKFHDLVDQIPCYCGCDETVGHRSNLNCFIQKMNKDGSVIWDDHATRCEICLDIAATTIYDFNSGKSIEEIKEKIQKTYNQ